MSKKHHQEAHVSQYDEPVIERKKKTVKEKKTSEFTVPPELAGANDWEKNKSRNRRERNLQKKHERRHNVFDDEYEDYDNYN